VRPVATPFFGGTRVDVDGVSVGVDHFIGGRRIAGPSSFEDRSPLDWSVTLASVARGDAHTADLAVQAAVDAFPEWAAMGTKARGAIMRRVADLIDEHVPSLAIVEAHATSAPTRISPSSTRNGCGRRTARPTA
jgi:acyl-CoA reductase-like NAD-dependent aldehyde dehydrogenase